MHTQIEQYLEQVETRLVDLPVAQRAGEVEEIRQHMEASVAAFVQRGCSPEEAVTRTLEQFGRAQTVGAELARAHDRRRRTRWDNVPMAAVVFMAVRWLLHTGKGMLSPNIYALSIMANGSVYYVSPAAFASGMIFWLVMAFAAGCLTAQVAPRRAIAGIVLWHVITFAISVCAFLLLLRQIPAVQHDYVTHSVFMSWLESFLVYMPVGMLGARLGRIWKQRQRRRMEIAR
jgi:hypothetical protein